MAKKESYKKDFTGREPDYSHLKDEDFSRVEVEIFGEHYILKGNESPDYMRGLAQHVNKKMRQVVTRNPMLGLSRASVLTALNIADEFMKLQKDYNNLADLFEPDKKKKEKVKQG